MSENRVRTKKGKNEDVCGDCNYSGERTSVEFERNELSESEIH